MCNQLKVTFYKFRNFLFFYLAGILMAGMGFYSAFKLTSMVPDVNVYDAFLMCINDTSIMFIPTLITAWFLGNDFSNRTIHHEITIGYSRWSVMLVRELPVLLSGVILHFVFVFVTVFGVGCKNGFAGGLFGSRDIFWCLTIMLQVIAMQAMIAMIAFICGKATTAIAASICFIIIVCNVLRNFVSEKVYSKTVFCLAADHSGDTLITASVIAVITLVLTIAVTYLIFRRKEIK